MEHHLRVSIIGLSNNYKCTNLRQLELWLRYITWENSIGQLQKGTALYWRAMKTVKDASTFSTLHSQYINTQ